MRSNVAPHDTIATLPVERGVGIFMQHFDISSARERSWCHPIIKTLKRFFKYIHRKVLLVIDE